ERPGAAVGARCTHVGRLAGVGAQDVGEALAAEVLAAHPRRAREAHRTAAPVATSDRRVSRMSVASIEDLRRAFVRCHDRRVPRPLRRSRLTARRTGPSVRDVTVRVAVLASGAGTNLQALLDDAVVGPWVVLAISDRGDASALERARTRSVEALPVDPASSADRAEFDHALVEILRERSIDLVVLAGYMRIAGPELVGAFRDRILNVHPALLPAFPGTSAVADALAWGVKLTGVTVHLVDEEVDHGPMVFQEAVGVL